MDDTEDLPIGKTWREPLRRNEPTAEQVDARRRQREAKVLEWAARAQAAQRQAAEALDRLVSLAERSDTGQARTAAAFVAAFVGHHQFDMYSLRSLDVELSDAVLTCLDAIRWAQCPLPDLLPNGRERIEAVCIGWGFKPPSEVAY